MGGLPLKMEGSDQQLLRCACPVVNPGGGPLGRPVFLLLGSHRQGAPPLVHQARNVGESSGGHGWSRGRQGKEREYSFPLIGPQGQDHDLTTWTKVIGVTISDIRVGCDGQIFARNQSPGPLESADLAHMALAAQTGGAKLSDEPSPLVEAVGSDGVVSGSGELQVFPYLQLVPPHCRTCRC